MFQLIELSSGQFTNHIEGTFNKFIKYFQQMHYMRLKLHTSNSPLYDKYAPTCFDPSGPSSGSSEYPY